MIKYSLLVRKIAPLCMSFIINVGTSPYIFMNVAFFEKVTAEIKATSDVTDETITVPKDGNQICTYT